MRKPLIFSLAFHLLLILVAIFGLPRFTQRAEPMSAVQVSLIAAADLDTPGPITPAPVAPEPQPEPQPEPDPVPVPEPTPIPEPAAPDPGPVTEVETAPPPPVERVAPVPEVESPLPEGPTLVPPRTDVPSPEPEPLPEELESAAPEEASPEIVTEAVETVEDQALAVRTAPRPAPRPTRPVRVEPDPEPEPTPEPQPQPEPEPAPVDPIAAAVAAALSETQTTPATSTSTGPPLTGQERDSLRLAVSQCWNLGSSSTEALRVTVTVAMDMQTDGKPVASSIRMIDFEGGGRDAANIAYDAARRAILRCQSTGYPLPADKYDQWKQIEMTFNPERMRQR